MIVRVHKKVGESIERLAKAADLVQLDPLEIVLNLPVETRGSYKAQQAATVQISGAAQWHPATVTFVDPVVDFASNSYRVKVRLPNPGAKIQAGLRAKVNLSEK